MNTTRLAEMLTPKAEPVEITIAPKVIGRRTAWAVVCSEHGAADELRESFDQAVRFVKLHMKEHHLGGATVRRVRERAPLGRRGRRRGA